MEPNLEPRRRQERPPQRPFIQEQKLREAPISRPSIVTVNEDRGPDYVRPVCLIMGVVLISIGLIGFVMDNFLAAHLSYSHSLIHVVVGVLALGFGYYSNEAARIFSYAAGTVFAGLGIIGFIAGSPGMSTVGHIGEDRFLWVIQREVLEFGVTDHVLHLLYAAVFFAGALFVMRRRKVVPTASSR